MDAAATDTPVLLAEKAGGVLILTLNRPQARNPLSEAMITALGDAFAACAEDKTVRAVVLAHNGPAFSAGHDMKEMTGRRADADGGRAYFKQLVTACSAMMQMVVRLPQPVIAAVEGVATAAGCQLVAACDLAIAGRDARFGTPGVNIGLFCSTPMVALSRNVSPKHAMEMLLTGDLISSDHAARIGLVNRVVEAGRARDEALALAQKVASKSTATVKIGKEAFYRQLTMDLGDAYAFGGEVMGQNMMFADASEGIGAFIEKRDPKWQDK